jgi:hypothetical protein
MPLDYSVATSSQFINLSLAILAVIIGVGCAFAGGFGRNVR